ncbi:hypothetical protein RIF29_40015 [Crotalaria pallida]|uniref:Uncharacterized protein n=1 Tax=Crotalaria pallida TaxID=3830 RepID=A0AAN9E2V4_CROPI
MHRQCKGPKIPSWSSAQTDNQVKAPSRIAHDSAAMAEISVEKKNKEAQMLKMISDKQNFEWNAYQNRKAEWEAILQQHVYHKSEEEVAHIYKIFQKGLVNSSNLKEPQANPSSLKEPPDIVMLNEASDSVVQELVCSGNVANKENPCVRD